MIGDDFASEAADSRHRIVTWLTQGLLFLSIIILLSSVNLFYAALKQVNQQTSVYAVKNTGVAYEVGSFLKTREAQESAAAAYLKK